MQRYIAFLRGMNLGKRRLPMSRLVTLFEQLGFDEVETFIASGNVLFSCKKTDSSKLEARIARHLEAALHYEVDTFVRTAEEVLAIAGAKIFPEEGQEGITVSVGLLQKELSPDVKRTFSAVRTPEDELQMIGREYYWLCRVRTPDSLVWKRPDIKALHLPTSTMRNITSIRKLVAKHLATPQPARRKATSS